MITLLYPCKNFQISSSWSDHVNRTGYNRAYAGTDFAAIPQPLHPSQFSGRVIQAMLSTMGYGYTTFVEYSDKSGPMLRIRNAHQQSLGVQVGDVVSPKKSLGILGSTGKSSGNHTHFEVWLKLKNGWQNVDPFDSQYEIKFVTDPSQLVPLGDAVIPTPEPTPKYEIPDICSQPVVSTSSYITSFIYLRKQPRVGSADIGEVRPGERWQMVGSHIDVLGNVWYALRKNFMLGWAAGIYNGNPYLVEVKEG